MMKKYHLNDANQSQEVTWTSSDELIASVDGNGKVLGKKCGIVSIVANAKDGSGKMGEIQFKVFHKNISGIKALCYNYNTNKITWNKDENASGYVVYRSTSKYGT